MIRHILFDLDGTLLPMDQDRFGEWYLPRLARHAAPEDIPAAHLPGLGRHGAKRRQCHQ